MGAKDALIASSVRLRSRLDGWVATSRTRIERDRSMRQTAWPDGPPSHAVPNILISGREEDFVLLARVRQVGHATGADTLRKVHLERGRRRIPPRPGGGDPAHLTASGAEACPCPEAPGLDMNRLDRAQRTDRQARSTGHQPDRDFLATCLTSVALP
jgi:hypothetical protein